MAQIKIYGIREHLEPIKAKLSDAIHSCIVDALQFSRDKRAHRFLSMIRLLFDRVATQCDRLPNEIEVTITETPKHNWGFRGMPGDEVGLSYKVEV